MRRGAGRGGSHGYGTHPATNGDVPPMETVVARLETASRLLHGVGDRATRLAEISHEVHILADDLRKVGPHLETAYPDVLDRVFSSMRDASAQPSLPASLRLAIFELVELRAAKWSLPSDTSNYYRQRRNLSETGEERVEVAEAVTPIADGQNFRQDVLIKNSDSGKVMGVRGRRVHVIEALSDTIISFEKVAPTAKERVLSINGYSQQSIGMAKHLIQETIERNASPVFDGAHLIEPECESELEATPVFLNATSFQPSTPQHEDLPQFKYSVTVGNDVIKISGKRLGLVQEAKLALDDYFYRKYPDLLCAPAEELTNSLRTRAHVQSNVNTPTCYSALPIDSTSKNSFRPQPQHMAFRYDRTTLLNLGQAEMPPPDFSHLDASLREMIVLKKRRPLDPTGLPQRCNSDGSPNHP